MAKQNLTAREKFGFGLGDMSSNIVFQAVANVLLYFYTDVYGITAASAGLLLMLVGYLDAVIDPAIGAAADRTRSKHGRYRPWMLWMAVPYGVVAVAAFITPDVSMGAKLVYAYISYALLVTAYSLINIPYSALGGAMTGDSEERANLQTWRFGLAMIGGFLVTTSIWPLARILGGGSEPENLQLGFPLAMIILAIIAVLGFLGCFKLTRERVYHDADVPKHSPWQDIRAMFTNSQWLIIALATFIIQVRGGMQGSAKAFYIDYYLVNNIGSIVSDNAFVRWFASTFAITENLIAAFMGLTMLAGVAGVIVANRLLRVLCKVRVMQIALGATVTMNLLLFLLPREWILQALTLTMLASFFHMMFIPLLFSAVPDTVDFGLRSCGKGAMAMFCAGHLVALNIGIAVGRYLTGAVLGLFGYEANAVQSETALRGILIAFAGSSIIGAILVIICLQFYRLTRGWQQRIPVAEHL
jgi:glycoside/pentoside/hexuronide:cation symporter, GPH family